MNAVDDAGPLADPVAEARRLIAAAAGEGLLLRALGGVAVYLLAPDGKPRIPRRVKDIDVAVPGGGGRLAARLLQRAGYVGDEMFNTLGPGTVGGTAYVPGGRAEVDEMAAAQPGRRQGALVSAAGRGRLTGWRPAMTASLPGTSDVR
jgi:hypothetical protein